VETFISTLSRKLMEAALTCSPTTTNLQFVFSGVIILVAVTLDCLKYVRKK